MADDDFDVVVVGGGTAGANAAYQFARRGRRVLVVERRPFDRGGAQWRNGVLDRHFVQADLEPPSGAERRPSHGTVHMRASDPRLGPSFRDPTVSADMALLGRRLRELATGSGAEALDEVTGFEVATDPATGRVRSLTLRQEGWATSRTVTASLFVDASGRGGALRRHARDLTPWCPDVRGNELCSATDAHYQVADPAGAERFLERHGARPGDAVTRVGVNGGFSTRVVHITADLSHVGVLVGCLANGRYGTGPKMIAELLRDEPWIGAVVSSGTGVIPLRRPFSRITAAGVALVGDAACQVFPAHGSGIGAGLIAGTMLAAGVGDADDPGDPHVLWSGYQAPYQRSLGRDLAGFDVLRRSTTRLGSTGVDGLVRSGLFTEQTARDGLEQRWAAPPPADAARSGARLARSSTSGGGHGAVTGEGTGSARSRRAPPGSARPGRVGRVGPPAHHDHGQSPRLNRASSTTIDHATMWRRRSVQS